MQNLVSKSGQTTTKAQQAAICHGKGPCLVLAGPGSGKTFVITRRIQNLIQNQHVDPATIMVITFSKAAATEMKQRFLDLCEGDYQPVTFGTFHAIFFQIVKRAYQLDQNHIIRETEKKSYLSEILENAPDELIVDEELKELLLREISIVKNEGVSIQNYHAKCVPEQYFREVFQAYRKRMAGERKIDFDDMVLLAYQVLKSREEVLQEWQNAFSYFLIDEFQDINPMQYAVMRLLIGEEQNLFVVGDDDQAIYGFRGARPEIMLHFDEDFPTTKKILLDYNFRSDANIVLSAIQVIKQNTVRFDKEIKPSFDAGDDAVRMKLYQRGEEEKEFLIRELQKKKEEGTLKDTAVLFRLNATAMELAEYMTANQIPYTLKESMPSFYDHFIVKDVEAYFRYLNGDHSRAAFFGIMNKPVRYLKRQMIGEGEVNFYDILRKCQGKPYMIDAVRKMQTDLSRMEKMTPFAALVYLRKAVGYEEYLKKLAMEREKPVLEYRKIVEELTQKLKEFDSFQAWFDHLLNLKTQREKAATRKPGENAVTLMTMHASKGLEWKYVYIPFVNEGTIPSPKAFLKQEIEEERRLFYVGMTRAKEQLVLTAVNNKEQNKEPSRFLSTFGQHKHNQKH